MPRRRRRGYSPPPRRHRSRQKKYGGGKFGSERQRRGMWANAPKAAHRWAHNKGTTKSMWAGMRRTKSYKRRGRRKGRRRKKR